MDIDDIFEIDDDLMEAVEPGLTEACASIKNSEYPKTTEAILMLQMNIAFLKNGIFKTAEDDNYYSMHVLLRSLCELFVKQYYMFLKFTENRDDSVGENYYKWTDIKEYLDYFKGLEKQRDLENKEKVEIDINQIISDVYAGYAEIPKNEKKENTTNYTFFKMLKYVNSKLKPPSAILTNMPTDYSIMSSFVHGGPHANRLQFFNAKDINNRENEIYQICKKAYLFSTLSLFNTFTFVTLSNNQNNLANYIKLSLEYSGKILD